MNTFIESYIDKSAACVYANFSDATDLKPKVMAMFRAMGTEHTRLAILNAYDQPFPVKAVDDYLRKHPEKVRKVTELHLEFNRRKSVELLEMVRKIFPNIRDLMLPTSPSHPIGHALAQYAQMPKLRRLHLPFSVNDLAVHLQQNEPTLLTQVKYLMCCTFGPNDTFKSFESTLPIIFPNLQQLHCPCPNGEFVEQVYANLGRLFPKIKMCKAVDASDLTAIVQEQQENTTFPIKVSEGSGITEIDY